MKASMIWIGVLALSLSRWSIVAGGEDRNCPYVRLSTEAACRKACDGAADPGTLYQVCKETLRYESTEKATVYTWEAGRWASWAHFETMELARGLLRNWSISGDERAAYESCLKSYEAPYEALLLIVEDMMFDQCVADEFRDLKAAVKGMEVCRDRVAKLHLEPSPMLARVKLDINKAMLVYLLAGKLLGLQY